MGEETRVRQGFLLAPKTINGETRWLKYAKWEEEYFIEGLTIKTATFMGWRAVQWLDYQE